MKYYVIINGNSSLDIQGLAIESLPNISKPLIRTTREEIDGRDGDIITKLGYSAYDKTLNIGLWGNYDINEVIAFFNEEGVITFSNEPDKYYKFHILNRIDFVNQLEKFKKASITIHCQPFKYKEQEAKVIEEEAHTTSGTSFNLSDTLEAPLLIDLKGNTSQTTYTGRSLFDFMNSAYSTEPNITVDKLSTGYKITNGSSVNRRILFDGVSVSSSNSYVISFELVNTSGTRVEVGWVGSGKTIATNDTSGKMAQAFTGITTSAFSIYCGANTSITITNIMIYQGTDTTLPYEPYVGGVPSPNPSYPQAVKVVSGNNTITISDGTETTTYNIDLPVKNLFDKDNANVLNAYLTITQSTIQSSSNDKCIWIECKGNTTYTITKMVQATSSYNRFAIATTTIEPATGVEKYNQTADVNASSITYTTNSTAKYLVLFIYTTNSEKTLQDVLNSIQIEEGSKPNTYTPYGTTPIELNKIGTYQDYIYKENDKWYLHKEVGKYIIDGNETLSAGNINTDSTNTTRVLIGVLTNAPSVANFMVLSNQFIGKANWSLDEEGAYANNNNLVFRINKTSGGTTTDSIKSWFSSHNASIYYGLATPTNTEITYTPLIEQLNTLEEAQSKEGTTNINQVNNDLPFIIDLTYYTGDTSITITNDGNIYSKPLLELKGTGNINIYLNGIQVFVVSLNNEIIYIDTDKMEAYYQGTLKNRQVVGDYNNFKLQSGNNTIQVDGGYVEYLKITNYSRWV